jgi:uncharacterized protein YebE (UPF0316 family)
MIDYFVSYPYVLGALIFLARIVDVSFGTVRTIMVFRGRRVLAAALGFFEVVIWVAAAGTVLTNLDRWYLVFAYAGGFAVGNVVGMWIEGRIALGYEMVRVISQDSCVGVAQTLRDRGYEVTALPGRGAESVPVEVLLVTERRKFVPELMQTIYELDPEATCTITDVKGQPFRSAPPVSPVALPDWRRLAKKK